MYDGLIKDILSIALHMEGKQNKKILQNLIEIMREHPKVEFKKYRGMYR